MSGYERGARLRPSVDRLGTSGGRLQAKFADCAGAPEGARLSSSGDGISDAEGPFDRDRLLSIDAMYGRRCGRSFICAALDEAEHQLRRIKSALALRERERARQAAAQLESTAASWAAIKVARSAARFSEHASADADADAGAAAAQIGLAIAEARRALYRRD